VESANDVATDFPIQNLPLGVFYNRDADEDELDGRVGVAIGDFVLDVALLAEEGLLDLVAEAGDGDDDPEEFADDFSQPTLEFVISGGPDRMRALRARLVELLTEGNEILAGDDDLVDRALIPMEHAALLLPAESRDYTDFYCSLHHATNVGSMFRPDNPLLPNYKWIPIGYHGRASTLVASGAEVVRPCGQLKGDDDSPPVFGPSQRLDYELEVGFYVGHGTEVGDRVPMERAEDHIVGLTLVNDWSARDMQKWEYQPLGPFLAAGDPKPLPHLDGAENREAGGIDLTLEVWLASEQMRKKGMDPVRLSRGTFSQMYWTIAQMLAHHASNGCALNPGDLMASGTVSGPTRDSRGCLLELSWEGDPWADPPITKPGTARTPIELPTGEKRVFLADGDEVIIRGFCERSGYRRIGFGECRGIVAPAVS